MTVRIATPEGVLAAASTAVAVPVSAEPAPVHAVSNKAAIASVGAGLCIDSAISIHSTIINRLRSDAAVRQWYGAFPGSPQ